VSGTSFNGLSAQDGYNLGADYGPSGMDIRHSLNFVGVYTYPSVRGQTYGQQCEWVLDAALEDGNSNHGPDLLWVSGSPCFGPNNSNTNNGGWGLTRANHYRRLDHSHRSIENWWGTDPSAAALQWPRQWGLRAMERHYTEHVRYCEQQYRNVAQVSVKSTVSGSKMSM